MINKNFPHISLRVKSFKEFLKIQLFVKIFRKGILDISKKLNLYLKHHCVKYATIRAFSDPFLFALSL